MPFICSHLWNWCPSESIPFGATKTSLLLSRIELIYMNGHRGIPYYFFLGLPCTICPLYGQDRLSIICCPLRMGWTGGNGLLNDFTLPLGNDLHSQVFATKQHPWPRHANHRYIGYLPWYFRAVFSIPIIIGCHRRKRIAVFSLTSSINDIRIFLQFFETGPVTSVP